MKNLRKIRKQIEKGIQKTLFSYTLIQPRPKPIEIEYSQNIGDPRINIIRNRFMTAWGIVEETIIKKQVILTPQTL